MVVHIHGGTPLEILERGTERIPGADAPLLLLLESIVSALPYYPSTSRPRKPKSEVKNAG